MPITMTCRRCGASVTVPHRSGPGELVRSSADELRAWDDTHAEHCLGDAPDED